MSYLSCKRVECLKSRWTACGSRGVDLKSNSYFIIYARQAVEVERREIKPFHIVTQ